MTEPAKIIHSTRTIPRTTSTPLDDPHQLIEGSVDARIFENKSDVIRHVLRNYFDEHEDDRLAALSTCTNVTKSASGKPLD